MYAIRAVDRVCDILDRLRRTETPLTLAELHLQVDMPKSSLLRYLSALERRGYCERDRDDGYHVGPALRAPDAEYLGRVAQVALPHLVALRDRFEETVNLGVLDGHEVVHVEVVESARAVRLAAHRGQRASIHATAIGKVIAGALDERDLIALLHRAGMPAFTARTIVDANTFLAEVRRTVERGYGLDDCEHQVDGRCVAVALPGLTVPAAVSVSAPAARLSAEESARVAAQLQDSLGPLQADVHSVAR